MNGLGMLPMVTAGPTYTGATRTLAWTQTAGNVSPELSIVTVQGYRNGESWWRQIVTRNAASPFVVPPAPPGAFDFNVGVGEATYLEVDHYGGTFDYGAELAAFYGHDPVNGTRYQLPDGVMRMSENNAPQSINATGGVTRARTAESPDRRRR